MHDEVTERIAGIWAGGLKPLPVVFFFRLGHSYNLSIYLTLVSQRLQSPQPARTNRAFTNYRQFSGQRHRIQKIETLTDGCRHSFVVNMPHHANAIFLEDELSED